MTDESTKVLKNELEEWLHDSLTLPGNAKPSIGELIPDDFLADNTEFDSLDQFLSEAPLSEEGENLIEPDIDDFVMANSDFGSWQQLQQKIEVRWMKNGLNN
ncbi:MAG: hypothetical protein ABEK50_03010 [bacterium]